MKTQEELNYEKQRMKLWRQVYAIAIADKYNPYDSDRASSSANDAVSEFDNKFKTTQK